MIEVGVETGMLGILGLLLMWMGLLRGAANRLPLLIVIAYALSNGSIAYLAPALAAFVVAGVPRAAFASASLHPRRRFGEAAESALRS